MENQAQNFIIPKQIRDALVNYLVGRPYAEVAQAVDALISLQVAPEIAAEDPNAPKSE